MTRERPPPPPPGFPPPGIGAPPPPRAPPGAKNLRGGWAAACPCARVSSLMRPNAARRRARRPAPMRQQRGTSAWSPSGTCPPRAARVARPGSRRESGRRDAGRRFARTSHSIEPAVIRMRRTRRRSPTQSPEHERRQSDDHVALIPDHGRQVHLAPVCGWYHEQVEAAADSSVLQGERWGLVERAVVGARGQGCTGGTPRTPAPPAAGACRRGAAGGLAVERAPPVAAKIRTHRWAWHHPPASTGGARRRPPPQPAPPHTQPPAAGHGLGEGVQ